MPDCKAPTWLFPISQGALSECPLPTDDELAMVTGDRVVITDIIDADWVRGRLEKDGADGKVGMFPLSFVKSSPRMVKCVQDFEAEHEDELSLKVRPVHLNVLAS